MTSSNIMDIELDKLEIHPKNVRKEYEDIEELAQSIKENGIMQNLTVVPDPEHEGKYLVVIGNRRLTAARLAGIETAPCIINTHMTEREQISTMLTENMNRKDLKVYEEAAAMQMCFSDYGFDIGELENKTGLSKTTINHRLNIAKLDTKVLQSKISSEEFQLTLKDLYALEKIKDIKTRNKVLKEARDANELTWRINGAAEEEIIQAHLLVFQKLLKDRKIKKANEKQENEHYTSKWKEVKRYYLKEDPPSKLVLPGNKGNEEAMFWMRSYSYLIIYEPNVKEKPDNRLKTKEELEAEKQERRAKKIKEITKNIIKDMKDFVVAYFEGRIDCRLSNIEKEDLDRKLWEIFKKIRWISEEHIVEGMIGPRWDGSMPNEERETAREDAKKLSVIDQKLACALGCLSANEIQLVTWTGKYSEEAGEKLKLYHDALTCFGYCYLTDDMAKVADGTHEFYKKDDEKEDEDE